jgi:tetratricopeptide (TPR) repeat protein
VKEVVCLLAVAALLSSESVRPHIKAALAAYEDGKAAQRDKQVSRAIDSFSRAIEIEPTLLDAREALISVYLESGRRVEAAACMTQFLEIKPDALRYRLQLGKILLDQKQVERALAQFSLVLQKDPYNAEGLLGFAAAARQSGMEDRAAEAIRVGRKHYPSDDRFKGTPSNGPQ